ncbi:MAG: tRNA (adenosine(37)-N6)-threonylcarbamoyltransferase complex dimerization subunit type 1 TsaB [Rickettsiales bacterium]|nr:MAG: tRNA (adenosine(37)-N6)-threonylcarbamoyltransferase complex dimerization subunit type 1 TsaB [Rickettsiales bacterium]
MNKILAFDVSNNSCSVAISLDQEILAFEQELEPSMQAERLMVLIESVLKKARLQYQDIDYLAVTTGPGSFTGIRIGIAAARGIIFASNGIASNIKGIGITNFEASYYRACEQVKDHDSALIMLNAYRGQLYVQEFAGGVPSAEARIIDDSELKSLLQNRSGVTICAGSGLAKSYAEIKELDDFITSDLIILPRFPVIRALHIARLAGQKIKRGEITPIAPLYIRKPDAIIPKPFAEILAKKSRSKGG